VIAAPERHDLEISDAKSWFGPDSMAPVYALNELLLSLLDAERLRPASENRVQLALELSEGMQRLDAEGHRRLASCPIALVDAGFLDEGRWHAAIASSAAPTQTEALRGRFPYQAASRLALMALTLASTTSQVSLERACLVFGMSPGCARLFARLSLPVLESLAERHADWVRPRWEHRPRVWQTMLELAERPLPSGVPPIGFRAMQLQLGELALATPICAATRQIRR